MSDEKLVDAAIVKQDSAPSPLDQVASNLATLKPKDDPLLAISSKSLGDVLPVVMYEGAGTLTLNEAELSTLKRLQDTADEDVEIRPDGLVYAEHIHARRALTELFGASWALLPGSAIAQEKDGDKITIFQRWVLKVRGKYVGEAIGAGTYYTNNAKTNKSDAAEGAQSEALRRICAKSALGIGSNVWDRRFAREWRRKFAVQVWTKKGTYPPEKQWRRADDDPFETEVGLVAKDAPKPAPEKELKHESERRGNRSAEKGSPAADRESPEPEAPSSAVGCEQEGVPDTRSERNDAGDPAGASTPPKVHAQPMTSEPATPAAAVPQGEPMVTEGNWNLFQRSARLRKLIVGDDATQAIALICTAVNIPLEAPKPGQKQTEVLRDLFKARTAKEFNEAILPKLRERG